MKIYLIGMPLSGKTEVAKILAERLNYKFVDIYTEIEKSSLMYIDEIVEKYDYKTVFKEETNILNSLLNEDNLVIATTDGVVLDRKNKKLLDGLVIYLDVDVKVLEDRKKDSYPKVMLENASIEDISTKRFLQYQNFATIIINNNNIEINDTIDNIIIELEKKN